MRALYKDQLVDYNEGNTEFVKEFNKQIRENGAVVYNHATNTYQHIHKFEDINFINEFMPDFFKVRESKVPNGMEIEMHYEFKPEDYADDAEIQAIWLQVQQEGLPLYDYDEEGELFFKDFIEISTAPSKHTIWILDEKGMDLLGGYDALLIVPAIKYLHIARELINNHSVNPFE